MKLNKKQKSIVVLILLVEIMAVMSASAAIQSTSVELRGTVTGGCPCYWDANNFAGFWYDVNSNLKTESLTITEPLSWDTIVENTLWYNTTKVNRYLKVYENGHSSTELTTLFPGGMYSLVGWQGKPYIAVKDNANKLAELVIEQGNETSEKKTLTVGETWDIGDRWTLKVRNINASSVRLVLNKSGVMKDDKILYAGEVYVYNESIANETNVPLFVTYVDSVFEGATADMVQLRYTWAISTNITELKVNDKFGNMEVVQADGTDVKLNNKDTAITLNTGSIIDVMGEVKFRVADDPTSFRFYPMVERTQLGTYIVRGEVFDETTGNIPNQNVAVDWEPAVAGAEVTDPDGNPIAFSWDANNFAGFWYDLDEGLSSEVLFSSDNTLGVGFGDTTLADTALGRELFYATNVQLVEYEAHKNVQDNPLTTGVNNDPVEIEQGIDCDLDTPADGIQADEKRACYGKLGWLAEEYVALDSNAKKLSKLIIEQESGASEKKTLTVGETWDIGEGWTLSAQSIDAKADPRQAWLVLSYNGVKLDDKIVRQGELYTYVENSIGGESDVPIFVTFVDSVFAGATTDMVQLRYTWAISREITEVKSGDTIGVFNVRAACPYGILLELDSSIDLTPDSTIDLAGNFKLKVADDCTALRFYPMVEYEIIPSSGGGGGGGSYNNTVIFEPETWNLVSVPKTLDNPAVDVAFVNMSLDTDNVKWYFDAFSGAPWIHPSNIEPLIGYWVYNNASFPVYQTLQYKDMSGPNVPPSISLKSGWNLIGHTSTMSMPVSSALVSINGKYSHLLSYSPDDGWKMYIVGNPALQQFDDFEPGRGYWIFMTQDSTYAAVEI